MVSKELVRLHWGSHGISKQLAQMLGRLYDLCSMERVCEKRVGGSRASPRERAGTGTTRQKQQICSHKRTSDHKGK